MFKNEIFHLSYSQLTLLKVWGWESTCKNPPFSVSGRLTVRTILEDVGFSEHLQHLFSSQFYVAAFYLFLLCTAELYVEKK